MISIARAHSQNFSLHKYDFFFIYCLLRFLFELLSNEHPERKIKINNKWIGERSLCVCVCLCLVALTINDTIETERNKTKWGRTAPRSLLVQHTVLPRYQLCAVCPRNANERMLVVLDSVIRCTIWYAMHTAAQRRVRFVRGEDPWTTTPHTPHGQAETIEELASRIFVVFERHTHICKITANATRLNKTYTKHKHAQTFNSNNAIACTIFLFIHFFFIIILFHCFIIRQRDGESHPRTPLLLWIWIYILLFCLLLIILLWFCDFIGVLFAVHLAFRFFYEMGIRLFGRSVGCEGEGILITSFNLYGNRINDVDNEVRARINWFAFFRSNSTGLFIGSLSYILFVLWQEIIVC